MARNAIGLLRVSSEAQATEDRLGLPAQRRACEQIARANDLQISEGDWVTLDGVSGAAVLDDPRFRKLLHRLASPEIVAVVVADFDRLFRRARFEDFQILDAFADTGTLIFTADGQIDPTKDADALISILRGEIAGMERRKIAERTRRAREEKRRRGLRAEGQGLPRGVCFDHETNEWSYAPEEEKARIQKVYRLWIESEGSLSFAHIAREVGLGTGKSSNLSWAVHSILRQPLYKGVYRVDRHWVKQRDPKTGKMRVRPVPREDWETYEHVVLDPPLVSVDEWERAQVLLDLKRPKRPPRRDPDQQEGTYPGFVECAECDAHLWVHPSATKNTKWGPSIQAASYLCPNSRAKGCGTGSTSQRLADPIIDTALEMRLGDRRTLEQLIREASVEAASRASASARGLQRRLDELSGQRARVQDGFVKGLFDADEAAKRLRQVDDVWSEIEAQMATEDRPPALSEDLIASVVDVFSHYRDLSRDEKRQLLRSFEIRVRVRKVPGAGRRRVLEVDSIRLGLFHDNAVIYKKMKRLGIE